jgi:hypothetical protein
MDQIPAAYEDVRRHRRGAVRGDPERRSPMRTRSASRRLDAAPAQRNDLVDGLESFVAVSDEQD